MPYSNVAPSEIQDILATSQLDPEWKAILERSPLPSGSDYELEILKELSAATYPRLRKQLDASRPANVTELDLIAKIPSTSLNVAEGTNRVILTFPKREDQTDQALELWPVILLFHGGGHTIGNPESELPLARLLVQRYNAVVILPAYRLAPEHVFPSSFSDCFEILKQVTIDISSPHPTILPASIKRQIGPTPDLIIGGTSAGATIAASIAHLYHNLRFASPEFGMPPLTGIFFASGTILGPEHIPKSYIPYYRSLTQNASTSPLDSDLAALFYDAVKPDRSSTIWASLDQYPELKRDSVGEDHIFLAKENVRVYIQVCGADIVRDDGLIYERVLREEAGVETRLDLYSGFGHVFWGMSGQYAEMSMTKQRMHDSVNGIGWLLKR